jgi:membrane protein YdbS with pleckstrin-like domain
MSWTTEAPRSAPASSEPQLRMLHPRVRYLWWVQGALSVLQIGVPVALLDWAVPHPAPSGIITAGVVAVLVIAAVVVPPVRYRRWRYALREEDLWIRHGVLTITVTVVPYRRLQFVDTKQGPLDRLFGLSQLVVHTAAIGTSAKLPGLAVDDAERLREVLAKLEPDDAAI